MKKKSLSILIVLCLLGLIFTSCTPAVITEPSPSEMQSVAEATELPAPTATAEPIPCMIAFDSDRDGNREIYVMNPDGTDPVNLTNNPGDDWDPACHRTATRSLLSLIVKMNKVVDNISTL